MADRMLCSSTFTAAVNVQETAARCALCSNAPVFASYCRDVQDGQFLQLLLHTSSMVEM